LKTAGDLRVVGEDCLDFEVASVRRLVVLAASRDGSSSGDYAAVFIHINDVDDYPARFSAVRQVALVAEAAPTATIVARLPPLIDAGLSFHDVQRFSKQNA